MSLELLVLTMEDVLIRTADLHGSGLDVALRERDASRRPDDNACIAACAQQPIRIRPQALQLMRSAELDGARLALAAPISSRLLCALLESAIGACWVDRFTVVATADALSAREGEADLYKLVLRIAELPAHRALLVGATPGSLRAARAIGMHAAGVLPHDNRTPPVSIALSDSPHAVWPAFCDLESIVTARHSGATESRPLAVSAAG